MAKLTIPALVEGGKANAGPPLGPSLAPTGINIAQVIAGINEKTREFVGMQVPVKVHVDKSAKTFEIEVGTPPTSALLKKECGISAPVKEEAGVKGKKPIGNITIAQAVKVAKMKDGSTSAKTLKAKVKQVVGTCVSLGVNVEGKPAKETMKEITAGKYDSQLKG